MMDNKRFREQASLVPPVVAQLALGILEKTAEKTQGGVREVGPELVGAAGGGLLGRELVARGQRANVDKYIAESLGKVQAGHTPQAVDKALGHRLTRGRIMGGALGAATGIGLTHGAKRLYRYYKGGRGE